MDTVKFTQMKDGDREDYVFLTAHETEYAAKTGDRLLGAMVDLDKSMSGYKITRLEHSLQAATRAWRDGADSDWIVSVLLHDIGDNYAPYNHGQYAAAVIAPFVREQCSWVVERHADFQLVFYGQYVGADPNKRQRYRDHPYYQDCVDFCEKWDQSSFDPNYPTESLQFFSPMVRTVFSRKAYDQDIIRPNESMPLYDPLAAQSRIGSLAL
jgi:predicted HD phosphohydrolase